MKLHPTSIILLLVVPMFFSSCSLATLSFSTFFKESNESEAISKIIYLGVTIESTGEETIISWNDYKISASGEDNVYQNSYTILRSYTNPWENFEKIGKISDSSIKEKRTRLSYVDKNITTRSPSVWYRINFSYSKKSGDKYITEVILSEAVSN